MPLPIPRDQMEVGSLEWAQATVRHAQRLWHSVECTEARWRTVLEELKVGEAWKPLRKSSLNALLKTVIGMTAAQSVRHLGPRGGQPGNQNAATVVRRVKDDVRNWENEPCNTRLVFGDAQHWIARLERDAADESSPKHEVAIRLLPKVKADEMSPHAAAVEAKYRRTYTAVEQLHRWWKKATKDERLEFLRSIREIDG